MQSGSISLPLVGTRVSRFVIDYCLTIELVAVNFTMPTLTIIEGDFTYKVNGKDSRLSPEQPETLGIVIGLLQHEVINATCNSAGDLTLAFESDKRIEVAANKQFESWHIISSHEGHSFRVTCMPGGRLAIWDEDVGRLGEIENFDDQ